MPDVIGDLPNVGGALCSTPQSLADAHYMPCGNAAKTRNPSKLAGVPQTHYRSKPLVGRSSPYCEDMWRRNCCLTFFSYCQYVPWLRDIARQSCGMVRRWRILGDFSASCISSEPRAVHFRPASKFALRPHRVWKYGRHPICAG